MTGLGSWELTRYHSAKRDRIRTYLHVYTKGRARGRRLQVFSVLGLVAICYVPVLALFGAIRAMGGTSASGEVNDDASTAHPWDEDRTGADDYHSETVLGGETPEPPTDDTETPNVSVHCPRCGTANDSRFAYCQECVRPLSQPSMASD